MILPTTIYLIYDINEPLADLNIDIIKSLTELKDLQYGTTYQQLIKARKDSLGYGYGYPKYKDEVLIYVLPALVMGLEVDPNSTAIKEVTEEEYINNYLPTFDVIDEDI